MADTFTATWQAVFGWLGSLLDMPLPYFFGTEQLNLTDIILGTLGLLIAVASVRALVGHGFSVAGQRLTEDPADRFVRQKQNADYKSAKSKLKNGPVDVKDLDL